MGRTKKEKVEGELMGTGRQAGREGGREGGRESSWLASDGRTCPFPRLHPSLSSLHPSPQW